MKYQTHQKEKVLILFTPKTTHPSDFLFSPLVREDILTVHPINRCSKPLGGINALIPAAVLYTVMALLALVGLFGYSLYPWRRYRTSYFFEAPVILWGSLFAICACKSLLFSLSLTLSHILKISPPKKFEWLPFSWTSRGTPLHAIWLSARFS